MHNITKNKFLELEESGLSANESAVYLGLLEIGKGSVLEISRASKVERTNAYRILQKLLAIPLIQTFKEENKTKWAALHPRYLLEHVQKRRRVVQELFPELEALYNLNQDKPKLSYFEGMEALGDLTALIVRETKARSELLSFSAPGAASGYYSNKRFLELASERIKKQITSKILIPTIEDIPSYKIGMDFKNWRHVKLVSQDKFPFKATINIWNNKVALLTVKSHPIGVVIESKDISDTLRAIFELVWAQIKDQKEQLD